MSPSSSLRDRPPVVADPGVALASAREHLYAAFERVPFDPDMPHSPGSVSEADVAALGVAVATMEPAVVARFLLKAGTTWGRPADIRRIVPRALDLLADDQLPLDRGLVWAKLRWAGWPQWPTYQALTVREFLRAEWARLLRSDPRPAHLAHRWLGDVAGGSDGLEPFLGDWLDAVRTLLPAAHHRAATGHLVVLLLQSPLRPDVARTAQELFPGRPEGAQEITAWLCSSDVEQALDRAHGALARTTDSRRVAVAMERLARFRAASSG